MMECKPAERVAIVKEANPPLRLAEPIFVEPSRKLTVPAGVPPAEVTVADIVTGVP